MPTTPKQMLLEHRYPGDLPADIAAMIAEGKGWRLVAAEVGERSRLKVSHESLRQWYGHASASAEAERRATA